MDKNSNILSSEAVSPGGPSYENFSISSRLLSFNLPLKWSVIGSGITYVDFAY